jgi:hypothetical protein
MNESQLVQTIKVHIAKGEKAAEKSQQHYVAAGQHLKTLKTQHSGSWAEWEALLKDKVGLSTGRASELMQIADGRKTVAALRTEKNETSKIAHAKERAAASSLNSEENADESTRKQPPKRAAEVAVSEMPPVAAMISGTVPPPNDDEPEAIDVLELVEEVLDGEPLTVKQTSTFEKIKKRLRRRAREDAKREAQNKKFLDEYKADVGPFVARLIAAGVARDLCLALTLRGPCGYKEGYAILSASAGRGHRGSARPRSL